MSSTPDLQAVIERLEKLEAENQVLRGKLEMAERTLEHLSTIGVEEVAARTFRLTDEIGMVRALLTSNPEGGVGLMLMDTNYQVRAGLRVDPTGVPSMELDGKEGKSQVLLNIENDDPFLTLMNKEGQICAQLCVHDGSPTLIGSRPEDTCGFIMLAEKDNAMFGIKATDGTYRVMLRVEQDALSLMLNDKQGQGGVGLGIGPNRSQMFLLDAKGKLLYAAPPLAEGEREEFLRYIREGLQKPLAERGRDRV